MPERSEARKQLKHMQVFVESFDKYLSEKPQPIERLIEARRVMSNILLLKQEQLNGKH